MIERAIDVIDSFNWGPGYDGSLEVVNIQQASFGSSSSYGAPSLKKEEHFSFGCIIWTG